MSQCLFQGFMRKEGGSVKSWKRRFFELTPQKLHYYRYTPGNTRAEHLNSIDIGSITKLTSYDALYRGYDFVIVLETVKRTYWLSSESRHEQMQWLKYIRMAMEGSIPEPEKAQEITREDLKLGQQMEVARCAVEIVRRSRGGLRTPHEEAYFQSLQLFHDDLKKWHAEERQRLGDESIPFPWDFATATCLLVMPEEKLSEEEREWVQKLHQEYDRYQERIKAYNNKSGSKIDENQQDEVVRRAQEIFDKVPEERTPEEEQYVKDLRASFWKLYRLERENGLRINHNKLSETLKLLNKASHGEFLSGAMEGGSS